MSLITLNGVSANVHLTNGVSRSEVEIGPGLEQAYDGTANRDTYGYKREWNLSYWVDTQANVAAFRNLLNSVTAPAFSGSDHFQIDNQPLHWRVDTSLAYSDKGAQSLTLSGSTPATLALSGGKWATGGVISLPAAVSQADFGIGYSLGVTGGIFGCWHNDAGTNNAYLFGWTGTASGSVVIKFIYLNGVAQALAFPSWFSLGATQFAIFGTGVATDAISDPFFYPFAPGDATTWATGLSTQQLAGQWPNACYLALAGSLGTANVMCIAPASKVYVGQLPGQGAFSETNELMDFVLREV
jgi:hypothetical protein